MHDYLAFHFNWQLNCIRKRTSERSRRRVIFNTRGNRPLTFQPTPLVPPQGIFNFPGQIPLL